LDEYLSRISLARLCGFVGVVQARSVVEPRATS
jgi:hypothetical protein